MTKVAIKNENITSFGGIYHIMDVFSKLGFEKLTESVLGRPGNPDDYIFLPTIGIYLENTGALTGIGTRGYYGSSTPRPDGTSNAYDLYVQEDEVHTGYGSRAHARWLWPK